jgi:hypothetical protein
VSERSPLENGNITRRLVECWRRMLDRIVSRALTSWQTSRSDALNEIEAAHRAIGGGAGRRGRRYATQQINQSYAVMLSSQFQGFCRELHDEALSAFAGALPTAMQQAIWLRFSEGRFLDRGNPTPGNLGSDFGRFGMTLWPDILAYDAANKRRQQQLEELASWRNAIAHQHFDSTKLGGRIRLGLGDVQRWRRACNALARSFDKVVADAIARLAGAPPW